MPRWSLRNRTRLRASLRLPVVLLLEAPAMTLGQEIAVRLGARLLAVALVGIWAIAWAATEPRTPRLRRARA